jgi:hypothetical protein
MATDNEQKKEDSFITTEISDKDNPFITREAAVILLLKIMMVSVASNVVILVLNILGDYYRDLGNLSPLSIVELDTVYGAIVIGMELIVMFFFFMTWYRKTYTVTRDAVVRQTGLIFRRGIAYQLHDVQSIAFKESFFGKIFGYANIWLIYSSRKEFLYAIPQARQFIAIVEDHIDRKRKAQIN